MSVVVAVACMLWCQRFPSQQTAGWLKSWNQTPQPSAEQCSVTVNLRSQLIFLINRIGEGGNAIVSVRLFPPYLRNKPLTLNFCMWVGHGHSSQGIEGRGWHQRSNYNIKLYSFQTRIKLHCSRVLVACISAHRPAHQWVAANKYTAARRFCETNHPVV